MAIDDEVEIVVNHDPSSGNIVDGSKVPLPRFRKKSKTYVRSKEVRPEVILLPYAEVPGMDLSSRLYQLAEATVAKAKANEAAIQARKRPHVASLHAFGDSAFTLAAVDLAINNEASADTLSKASTLVKDGDHLNPSEAVLRSREGDLRNDIVATTHKIEYLLQYRAFVVSHHREVVQQLELRLPPPSLEEEIRPLGYVSA
ncbi:uncharacterized protein BT62DRAFT_923324 [Guyanagaster necrorhizus]|uniref:Uncharacterized protein n=1 Tax=Guyanagaster necrorhizus TaxID=856835 RepID=A0A9P8AN65_9AGAR|nr:uncharacterized protein BT62DRAFT_923324 [Guyanagaster necrorhizus MCA 3950]KAG7441560.1 hypothetical protein BT62DRAFT_923324 [Guyanagaster necrorhizus MCA 3950]